MSPSDQTMGQKPTNYRWMICGLLFAATTINYLDRSILTVISDDLKDPIKGIGWTDYQYGLINAGFSLAYGIGFLIMGWLIDRVGVRVMYAAGLIFWSLAAAAAGFARTPLQFGIARFFLGLGEAVNFPAAIRTVAEWFPQRQRATATGIFNAGSNIGIILAPLIVPFIVFRWGWPWAFFITGIIGLVWVFFWLPVYRPLESHKGVNAAEKQLILSDGTAGIVPKPVKWRFLLPHRQAWSFILGKFLTDPIWWFYLFWSGQFLRDTFKLSLKQIGWPLIVIYVMADFGSIGGGWLSSMLIKRGMTANAARKIAMLTCAICVLPVIFAPLTSQAWVAVLVIGVAAAAHQGFSANIFTLTSDMFPKRAVGSVVGLGGFSGAMGGVIMAAMAGLIKEVTGSYLIMFVIAGFIYLLAVAVVHGFAPTLRRISEEELESKPVPLAVWVLIWALLGLVAGVPISYFFQNHASVLATDFPRYMGAIFTGEIFTTTPPKDTPKELIEQVTQALRDRRAPLMPPLIWTPVIAAAILGACGGIFHGILNGVSRKKN